LQLGEHKGEIGIERIISSRIISVKSIIPLSGTNNPDSAIVSGVNAYN